MKDWIKCSEKLPELLQEVQVFGVGWKKVATLYYVGDGKFANTCNYNPSANLSEEELENYLIDEGNIIYDAEEIHSWAPLLDAPDIYDDVVKNIKISRTGKKKERMRVMAEMLQGASEGESALTEYYYNQLNKDSQEKLAFEEELEALLKKYSVTLKVDRSLAGKGKSIIAEFKFSKIDLGKEVKNENEYY